MSNAVDLKAHRDLTALSRTLAHALRHEPERYELELDSEGWTPIEAVVATLRNKRPDWQHLTATDIAEAIGGSSKRRYEMADGRIRALYGHTTPVKLARASAVPPGWLYHGTSPHALDAIRQSGLKPMTRQHVHLSFRRADAYQAGRRKHPKPVVLLVRAAEAAAAEVSFYLVSDGLWLADRIPWRFIVPGD